MIKMSFQIATKSELEASMLIHKYESIDTEPIDFHSDGDKIIMLAEKIKAERAVREMK